MALYSIVLLSIIYFALLTTAQSSQSSETCPSYPRVCGMSKSEASKTKSHHWNIRNGCAAMGEISSPQYLQTPCATPGYYQCMNNCLANPECQSFLFNATYSYTAPYPYTCSLYTAILQDQGYTYRFNYPGVIKGPGPLSYLNRYCFTYRPCPPDQFYLQVQPGSGTDYDGYYGLVLWGSIQFSATTTGNATIFGLETSAPYDLTYDLYGEGSSLYANAGYHPSEEYLDFSGPYQLRGDSASGHPRALASCSVSEEPPFIFSCNMDGETLFYLNGDFLKMEPSDRGSGSHQAVTILAVPVT